MRDKSFRIAKILQFILLALLEVLIIAVLITHPQLGQSIFSDHLLLLMAVMIWVLLVFSLFFLFYDFFKLRFFEEENRTLKRTAYMDVLTNFPNRRGLDAIFQTYSLPQDLVDMGCLIVLIDNLERINQELGHHAGDMLIQNFCSIFKRVGDHFGVVARNGGNEFISIIKHCDASRMEQFIQDMTQQIADYNQQCPHAPIQIKYAYTLNGKEHLKTFKELITAAYTKIK